jgi:hypothetical protein
MRLKEWMKKNRWNARAMGKEINICAHTIRSYMHGFDMPLRMAKLFVEFTGGEVGYEDLQPTKARAYKRPKNQTSKEQIQVNNVSKEGIGF